VKRVLQHELWVGYPIEDVFEFFSRAENLEEITPPELSFHILTPTPIAMHEGTLIDYRIKLGFVPMRWRSRITEWAPPQRFADEQLKGPYLSWYHTHTFEEKDGGTVIRDEVRYEVPGWFLEPLIHKLFVGRRLDRIFSYRQEAMEKRFPPGPASES
jgi:ligand-binding SRPBCC domain-containing protein